MLKQNFLKELLMSIIVHFCNFLKRTFCWRKIDLKKINNFKTGGYYIPRIKVYPKGLLCPNCSNIEWTKESPFYKPSPPPPPPSSRKLEDLIPTLKKTKNILYREGRRGPKEDAKQHP